MKPCGEYLDVDNGRRDLYAAMIMHDPDNMVHWGQPQRHGMAGDRDTRCLAPQTCASHGSYKRVKGRTCASHGSSAKMAPPGAGHWPAASPDAPYIRASQRVRCDIRCEDLLAISNTQCAWRITCASKALSRIEHLCTCAEVAAPWSCRYGRWHSEQDKVRERQQRQYVYDCRKVTRRSLQ